MIIYHNKLVRDNVAKELQNQGTKLEIHHANSDAEYLMKLKLKLQETINVFAKEESMETLSDVVEVLDAIMEVKKFDPKELEAVRQNRAIEHGTFKKRVVLDKTDEEIPQARQSTMNKEL